MKTGSRTIDLIFSFTGLAVLGLAGLLAMVTICITMYTGCTAQDRAKNFGGTAHVKVPCGQKVLNVTWKDEKDLWYLTRPFRPGEKPEEVTFRQKKDFGGRALTGDGKVVFKECEP